MGHVWIAGGVTAILIMLVISWRIGTLFGPEHSVFSLGASAGVNFNLDYPGKPLAEPMRSGSGPCKEGEIETKVVEWPGGFFLPLYGKYVRAIFDTRGCGGRQWQSKLPVTVGCISSRTLSVPGRDSVYMEGQDWSSWTGLLPDIMDSLIRRNSAKDNWISLQMEEEFYGSESPRELQGIFIHDPELGINLLAENLRGFMFDPETIWFSIDANAGDRVKIHTCPGTQVPLFRVSFTGALQRIVPDALVEVKRRHEHRDAGQALLSPGRIAWMIGRYSKPLLKWVMEEVLNSPDRLELIGDNVLLPLLKRYVEDNAVDKESLREFFTEVYCQTAWPSMHDNLRAYQNLHRRIVEGAQDECNAEGVGQFDLKRMVGEWSAFGYRRLVSGEEGPQALLTFRTKIDDALNMLGVDGDGACACDEKRLENFLALFGSDPK